MERRASDLKIEFVRQGTENKVDAFLAILALAEVSDSEVAFIGDDLNDIPLLRAGGTGSRRGQRV